MCTGMVSHPRPVDVGESAYARAGLTSRSLQVFANGVVLSLEATDAPGDYKFSFVAPAAYRDFEVTIHAV